MLRARPGEDVAGKVAVVTGAASGIGLASVQALTAAGIHVVLAGREQAALDDAVRRFVRPPGKATAMAADLRRPQDAEALAVRAMEIFGRLDVWVNNAAVTAFGTFDELPPEVFRQVIETNFFGYLHGMRAALAVFRPQGQGTVINVNSGVAFTGQPKTAAYVASKYADRAVGDVVRMELTLAGAHDVHVCTLYPAAIDTPLFQSGANYSGRGVRPLPPVHRAEKVAEAVVGLVRRPRPEATVGVPRRFLLLLQALAPAASRRWLARYIARRHFTDDAVTHTDGNVFAPLSGTARIDGGWRR